jgi:putative lipoic acid-binding regulatory protein
VQVSFNTDWKTPYNTTQLRYLVVEVIGFFWVLSQFTRAMKSQRQRRILGYCAALSLLCLTRTTAFLQLRHPSSQWRTAPLSLASKPAGAFFNPVPENNDSNKNKDGDDDGDEDKVDLDKSLERLLKERNAPSLASQPSTINGIPTSQAGLSFGFTKTTTTKVTVKKPFIGIGAPDKVLNDVTKPEYDDQGYTLYSDEKTGEKSRVFEALVSYPCDFTMKIVGANEGTFVQEMLQVVADSCLVEDITSIQHSTRTMGKWTSVTVQAPVKSAQMLYQLYEAIDRDPRVKFKF